MDDPFTEPADTREAILGAAFRALCEHGYADLTIKRIGEAFEKSPSLVYHHYDGKDELLLDLLEFLLDGFEAAVSTEAFDLPPRARLDAYVAAMTDPSDVDDAHAPDDGYVPDGRFFTAVVELRAQAATDEAYRAHFDRSDRVFRRFLERSVREAAVEVAEPSDRATDGADGAARSVAPAAVAATLQTLATGAMVRWTTTTDRDWVGGVREETDRYLSTALPAVDPDA
ncbi:TetR family transcriptional regulator [Halorubrum sp. 48-1-W]|uniref:TetR/AcrR family transcriptional regulator n=1 Tax=Halorubrum sp. 48-1-W TaxID=2249761 RepID=UPI000DCC0E36|nr:TetR/AcrR family transcriptional regulator [Halorubrum sp. 48-1-W]RAW44751.1 TetR family transcriptional regulator [Halorubrum sp. 48-1-W]